MENLPIFSKFIFIFGAFLLLTFYFSYLKSKCDFVKALSCCFVYFTLLLILDLPALQHKALVCFELFYCILFIMMYFCYYSLSYAFFKI